MTPLKCVGTFSNLLLEFSDFFVSDKVPHCIWTIILWEIYHDISLTRGEDYSFDLRLIDGENRFHLRSTYKFNFVTFDKDHVGTFWTPKEWLITIEFLNMLVSFLIWKGMQNFGLTKCFVENNIFVMLVSIHIFCRMQHVVFQL